MSSSTRKHPSHPVKMTGRKRFHLLQRPRATCPLAQDFSLLLFHMLKGGVFFPLPHWLESLFPSKELISTGFISPFSYADSFTRPSYLPPKVLWRIPRGHHHRFCSHMWHYHSPPPPPWRLFMLISSLSRIIIKMFLVFFRCLVRNHTHSHTNVHYNNNQKWGRTFYGGFSTSSLFGFSLFANLTG